MAKPRGTESSKPSEKEPAMEKSKGVTYDKQNEVVDGKAYEDCVFKQCTLIYKGGDLPQLTRCTFTNCDWQFQDAAARTLVFMSSLYHGGAKNIIDGFIQRMTGQAPAA